jgi:hypothetical protein
LQHHCIIFAAPLHYRCSITVLPLQCHCITVAASLHYLCSAIALRLRQNALPGQSRDNYRCSTTAAPIYRLEKTASSAQNKIFSRRIMSIFAKDSEIFQGNSSVFPVFSPKQEVPSNIYSKKA